MGDLLNGYLQVTSQQMCPTVPRLHKLKTHKSLKLYKRNMNGYLVGFRFLGFRFYEVTRK